MLRVGPCEPTDFPPIEAPGASGADHRRSQMSKKKKAVKAQAKAQSTAADAVEAAKPYVQRFVEDDDLRSNLREAYESARDAYDRASDGKKPSKLLEDKKLQG